MDKVETKLEQNDSVFTPFYNIFKSKLFKTTFLFIVLLEIFSLFGYLVPAFNSVIFFVILFITLILSLEKLEWGVYILLAELFLGSKGYLFYFDFSGISISIRLGLFLTVFGAWIYHVIKNKQVNFFKSKLFYYYLIFFVFLIWSFVNAIIKGNDFSNLFFDLNGYLFFGLVFIFYDVLNNSEKIKNTLTIFTAALLTTFIKISVLLFVFSHNMYYIMPSLYKWVRTTGIGEITAMEGGFYRIFFQAQIYTIIGFFIIISLLIFKDKINAKIFFKQQEYVMFATALLAGILISFSRSFWVSMLATFAVMLFILIIKFKAKFKKFVLSLFFLMILLVLSLAYTTVVVKFPYPSAQSGFSAELVSNRLKAITGEAGVSSRWNLLPEMIKRIKKHPILGSGFGSTITYKSEDPRVLYDYPDGMYTTYAFEWGYLDFIYKFGILGTIAYLVLLFKIWHTGWRAVKNTFDNEYVRNLLIGMLLGFVVLLGTHFFSPYLNHPLGIGYIIMCSVIFEYFSVSKKISVMNS